VRWSSGNVSDDVSLAIDRVASAWSAADVEANLMAGGFGGPSLSPRSRVRAAGRARDRFGSARARDLELEYAIVDLGREKLVARFAGRPAVVAYNRGVLRQSLESLEGDRLLTAELVRPVTLRLEGVSLPHPRAPAVLLPAGWTREGLDAFTVPGLGPADAAALSSPEGDFTVSCRTFWWEKGTPPRELGPAGAYERRDERLGVSYRIEGLFVALGRGVVAFEVVAPESKGKLVEGLLPAWRSAEGSTRR
jgi:hypothetical protein